jgi:hypothetical protein
MVINLRILLRVLQGQQIRLLKILAGQAIRVFDHLLQVPVAPVVLVVLVVFGLPQGRAVVLKVAECALQVPVEWGLFALVFPALVGQQMVREISISWSLIFTGLLHFLKNLALHRWLLLKMPSKNDTGILSVCNLTRFVNNKSFGE